MLIEKLNNSQVEKETAGYIKLFKNKTTGELMYLTKDNREVVFPTEDKVLQLITDNIPSSDYTETIVNISSAQILAMGDTPIELLPQLGAGKYYDVMKIVWEYNYGTASYSGLGTDKIQITQDGIVFSVDNEILTIGSATVSILEGSKLLQATNTPVLLTVQGSSNPTDGDGTLRLIITYTTRTFGV